MKGKLNGRYIKDTNSGGVYSLCDTIARNSKGCAANNDIVGSNTRKTNICPVTITPNVDGYIMVIMVSSATWGWDGGGVVFHVTCPDSSIKNINYMDGHAAGGNEIGRQITSISLWGPCTAGKNYRFVGNFTSGSALFGHDTYFNSFAFVI